MYLKSLTIRGFKSFARKTTLEFEPGVTIIVGPNGSGKSNIADAVMWVLGEQSPTSLRGNRMEDIIFSGSASQRPVGMAEVALTLDNTRNDFPLDYSEVTVSRNVVRGSDSEYRLNNSSCRLLDIQELLSDAGVGRTLNSVISQGNLDEVLSCRPEERREYIEEAGGLLKYRKRREKAVRRLARMEEELVRIDDVLREVRRQLRPLQRQAGKLEQYQSLIRELKESRLRLDVARLRMMQRAWQGHEEQQLKRADRLSELEAELAEKAGMVRELEQSEAGWRVTEASLRENLYRLVSMHEELKARLGAWDERLKVVRAKPVDPGELESLRSANEEAASRVAELEEDTAASRSAEKEAARRTAELNRSLNEVARRTAALEARQEVLFSGIEGAGAGVAERRLRQGEELSSLEEEEEELRAESAGLEAGSREAREKVSALEGERAGIEDLIERLFEVKLEREREQALLVTRLDILSQLDTESWGVINASSALLESDPTGGGLTGTLASSLEVEPRYEVAIMSFLGPWAFGLAARDTDCIRLAVDYLKEEGLGQSLFFWSGAGRGPAPEASRERAPDGTVSAREVVRAGEAFSDALDALLEGVFITGDLEIAFELAERYPRLVFLSPEGDVVSGGTLIKGGSPRVRRAHLEATKSRREGLEASLDECRQTLEKADLELLAARVRHGSLASQLRAARDRLDVSAGTERTCAERLAAVRAAMDVIRRDLEHKVEPGTEGAAAELDTDDAEARIEELHVEERGLTAELREAEEAFSAALEAARKHEAELVVLRRELDVGLDREREMRMSLEAAGSAAGFAIDEGQPELERGKALHEGLVALVREKREQVRQALDEGAARVDGASAKVRQMHDDISRLQKDHDDLRELSHGEDLSKAELKIKVEQLLERIVDEHKVPLEFALKQYPDEEPTPELETRVDELARGLEYIGPVNPEAITEREALEQRFNFLKEQIADVEEAKTQLKKVVRQVDREIEQKFSETIDEVNRNFKEIFSFLFPGGRAEIRLEDPDDLLASGVEIYVQPEGKKLRRISLLSGGETSLTALAFFFALFRVRPSPFYFLDEVEAALDDVNLHRFLDLVREFKDSSQLILITHQKRSMEIADILYGVTMQDDGVSRVVSQKVAS